RTQLAKQRMWMGELVPAKDLFDLTIQEYDKRTLNLDDANDLYELAEAARYTSQYALANDSYREAQKLAPQVTEIGVAWADLFSQKYASELAAQTLDEVFKINPNLPD